MKSVVMIIYYNYDIAFFFLFVRDSCVDVSKFNDKLRAATQILGVLAPEKNGWDSISSNERRALAS